MRATTQNNKYRHVSFTVAMSLTCGVLVYWFLREHLPHIAPNSLTLMRHTASEPASFTVAQNLPSFFHAYAMGLATAAVGYRKKLSLGISMSVTILLCLVLEAIQHPILQQKAQLLFTQTNALSIWITEYARSGTFDYFDILAIALGILIAGFHARHLKLFKLVTLEDKHVSTK